MILGRVIKKNMENNKNENANSKQERGGDTSRTSSQGRKLSSGGNLDKKGDPQQDEATHSPVKGAKNKKPVDKRGS